MKEFYLKHFLHSLSYLLVFHQNNKLLYLLQQVHGEGIVLQEIEEIMMGTGILDMLDLIQVMILYLEQIIMEHK